MSEIYNPCEPFQAYNRIEARPRQEELDHALSATIHDPLWMLARQYQFGEFKGEDAGSAIFAKVALNSVRMTGFKNGDFPEASIDNSRPLETTVEAIMPEIDNKTALRLGKKFLIIFNKMGAEDSSGLIYNPNQYADRLIAKFPFKVPEVDITMSAGQAAAQARQKSLESSNSFLRTIAGRALNGRALWEFFAGNKNRMNFLGIQGANQPNSNRFIFAEHKPLAISVADEWIKFVKAELNLPENDLSDCWHPEKLEYSFNTVVNEGNNGKTTIGADEYYQGHLDWYSFDVDKKSASGIKHYNPDIKRREVLTVIPTEASFAGMPNSRWWEMEDGTIDLGNLKASDTDIAKIIVSQYALQYSNDWLSIPYDLPTGSFTEVEGIIVTDTFGDKTFVEAAHNSVADEDKTVDWNEWNMFALTVKTTEFAKSEFDKRVLLPPAATKVHESEPIELVKFIRDEMANLVWGIESVVPNGLGGGIDGYEAAKNLKGLIDDLEDDTINQDTITLPTVDLNAPLEKANTYKPQLKYMLGNTVSENWIPFIAAHKTGSNREINFQRASMPRICEAFSPHAIRPRTQLLRIGINQADSQDTPYFLNEEEIPRSGVFVSGTFQRTRWYNGKVVTWYGRRKKTGRGEGSSGLRFDLVLDNK